MARINKIIFATVLLVSVSAVAPIRADTDEEISLDECKRQFDDHLNSIEVPSNIVTVAELIRTYDTEKKYSSLSEIIERFDIDPNRFVNTEDEAEDLRQAALDFSNEMYNVYVANYCTEQTNFQEFLKNSNSAADQLRYQKIKDYMDLCAEIFILGDFDFEDEE